LTNRQICRGEITVMGGKVRPALEREEPGKVASSAPGGFIDGVRPKCPIARNPWTYKIPPGGVNRHRVRQGLTKTRFGIRWNREKGDPATGVNAPLLASMVKAETMPGEPRYPLAT